MISAGVQKLRDALQVAQYLGYTKRSRRFNEASKYYWGNQYDHLQEWQDDAPLEEKAPRVQIRLTKAAVDQVNQHLFGAGRKPDFEVEALPGDEEDGEGDEADPLDQINTRLAELQENSRLAAQLPEIGRLGNLHGTVAVGFHIIDGRVDVEVLHAADAYPTFGYDNRQRAAELEVDFEELLELDEYWREVREDIDGEKTYFLHRRTWEPNRTVEYRPIEIDDQVEDAQELEWREDEERTVEHDLGFVPVEWIQNLPVSHDWDGQAAVEAPERKLEDEINYTLSQAGRGLRYNQEPQVVFTDVDNLKQGNPVKRGSKNTLRLESSMSGNGADAKLLELQGQGTEKAIKYVEKLREFFHEVTDTIEHDPERASGAMSGTAIRRLMRPLVALVGMERAQYGPSLARLLEKMLEALEGTRYNVTASWPDVVELTAQELLQVVQVARQAWNAGLVTLRTAVQLIAPFMSIDDIDSYIQELEAEAAARGAPTQSVAEEAFREAEQNLQNL